jgi:thiol:disulfide interchange protein
MNIPQTVQPVSSSPQTHRLQASRHRLAWLGGGLLLIIVLLLWPTLKGAWFRPPITADQIAWRTDYTSALAESVRSGKPVLLDFSATWCPPCQEMKRQAWPDARVSKLANADYIPVAMDADALGSHEPAVRYNVDTIPRLVIVNGQGRVLKEGAFMSADELADFLKSPPKGG